MRRSLKKPSHRERWLPVKNARDMGLNYSDRYAVIEWLMWRCGRVLIACEVIDADWIAPQGFVECFSDVDTTNDQIMR